MEQIPQTQLLLLLILPCGKTAYARGQMLVGTATGSVEEIYGPAEGDYEIDDMTTCANSETPDGKEAANPSSIFALSKDGRYCVRVVQGPYDGSKFNYYLESFAINSNGLYYQASANATTGDVEYKKYRYTSQELGLSFDIGAIVDIAFGCPGFGGDLNKCILAILTLSKVHFLVYHLTDNGIIGKAYDHETNYIDVEFNIRQEDDDGYYYGIAADKSNPMEFVVAYWFRREAYDQDIRFDRLAITQLVTNTQIVYSLSTYKGSAITGLSMNNWTARSF